MATKDELEEKVKEYEELIETVLKKETKIYRVITGPVKDKGVDYYTVSAGDGLKLVQMVKRFPLFQESVETLKKGIDVLVAGSAIVGVLPEELIAKEKLPEFKRIKWEEIGGLKSQIKIVRDSIETPLKNAKLMKEFGVEPIKGILLYGEPGCGKTMIAKAIASTILDHLKVKEAKDGAFIYLKGAELLSMYVGATEHQIAGIFHQAREYAIEHGHRAIIFLDEADALLRRRGTGLSSDVEKTIVPTFLSEMDGFDQYSPIVVLATNIPDALDPAILRPGRIDIKVRIGRPTVEDVKDIFKIYLAKVKTVDNINDLVEVGTDLIYNTKLKSTVSGAMIAEIVNSATRIALSRCISSGREKKGIIKEDIDTAVNNIMNDNAEAKEKGVRTDGFHVTARI